MNENEDPVENEPPSAIPAIEPTTDDFDPAPQSLADDEAQIELDDLKNRAKQLGVKHHPSIGVDKLREKIRAAMDDAVPLAKDIAESNAATNHAKGSDAAKKADQLRLVRVRITCMDPMKKAFSGDFFQTGNALVGTVKRYVPFGVEWHVPNILLKMIKRKEFQQFSEGERSARTGIPVINKRLVPAYSVDVLEPLSEEELGKLAQRQAMARGDATA